MLLLLASTTLAAPPPPRRPPPRPPAAPVATVREAGHDLSLTLDGVDLALGVADLTVELRVAPKTSLGLEGALGSDGEGLVGKGGLELRQYLLGDFDRGLYLGIGADYGNFHEFLPTTTALGVGPTVGAKYTLPVVPLTVGAEVGVDLVAAEDFLAVAPTVGVALGFSF